jgi:hypothetical protein
MVTYSGVFGTLASPIEIWSFTIKGQPVESSNTPQAKAFTAKNAYSAGLRQVLPSSVILTRTRFSQHAAGGLVEQTADGAYVQADDLTTVAGTDTGGAAIPLQSSVCVSLVTGRAGPSGKGRFFLPMPAAALDATWRLPIAKADAIAANAAATLDGLAAVLIPCVVSSKGFRTEVTAVRVGRVVDTIRTRRNAMVEEHQVRPLA